MAKASLVVEGDIISSPTATYEAWIKSKEEEISNLERDLNVLKVEWQTYQEPLDQVIRVCIPFLEHTANLADRRDLVQYLGAQSISALLMMPTIAESEKLYVPTVNSALWAAVTGSLYAFMRTSGGFNQLCNDWFGPDTAAGIHSHLLAYTGVDAHSLESDILSSGIIKIRQRLIEELNRGDTLASLERDGIKTTIDRFGRGETLQDVLAILWVFSRTFDINVTYFDRDTLIQGKFFSSHNGRPIVHVEQASGRHYAVLHHTLRAQIDTKRVTFGREVYGAGGDDTTASHVETDAIVTLLSPLSTEKPIVYTRLFKSAVASASHQEAEQNRRIEWLTTDLVELLSTSHRLVYLPNETSINLDAFGVKILGRPYAQDPTDKWALVPVTVGPTDFYFSEMLSDPTISDVLRTYALLHAVGYPIQISGPVACRDGKVTFQLLEEGTQRLVARVEIESRK